jgi:glutaredoxin/glutathione-dependent peroxiredoxin
VHSLVVIAEFCHLVPQQRGRMMIATPAPRRSEDAAVGDRIPDVTLMRMTAEGPAPVGSGEALCSGTVALFAVPGVFTPTCSDHTLPGYVRRADELRAMGVDTVSCIAVNDAFVLNAWGDAVGAGDKIVMLGDGNGEFAAAAGLELDGSAFGLGSRSRTTPRSTRTAWSGS